MDTKLKKFNDLLGVRVAAFILCVLLAVVSIVTLFISIIKIENTQFRGDPGDLLSGKTYEESNSVRDDLQESIRNTAVLLSLGNEEQIRKGNSIDPSLKKEVIKLYYQDLEWPNEIYNDGEGYYDYTDDSYINLSKDMLQFYNKVDGGDYLEMKSYDQSVEKLLLKNYKVEIDSYYNRLVENQKSEQLQEFADAKRALNGYEYYAQNGNAKTTNINEPEKTLSDSNYFTQFPIVLLFDKYDGYYGNNDFRHSFDDDIMSAYTESDQVNTLTDDNDLKDLTLNIGMNPELYAQKQGAYDQAQMATMIAIFVAIPCAVISFLLFVYLMIVTGRRDKDGNVKLYRADKWYTEIQLFILFIAIILGISLFVPITGGQLSGTVIEYGNYAVYSDSADTSGMSWIIAGIYGICEFIIGAIALWFTLSILRMIKAGIFLKRSIIVIVFMKLYVFVKTAFSTLNPMGKFVLIIIAACVLSMTVFLAPVVIVLLIAFGYNWIKKYTKVKEGVEEVCNGNLDYKIDVDENSKTEFDILAKRINTISQASNITIQNELKNQRLKTDLISNVSHDLKTPLTSIITYTDLMKKEGLTSPNAENYLAVIDEKSQRLKNLTEDLFEAAKASSGSIPVRLEKVDALSLINQGLVEFHEILSEKQLDVIVSSQGEKYYVTADSQLLWRVVENLLNNVSKYALENSRVYVDIKEEMVEGQFQQVIFEMKNMSKAPLNIPEDELMERFKRGDESRATEGSGLGLAIAKDLVKLQHGDFNLKIDGDLFKAVVVLNSYDERAVQEAQKTMDEQQRAEEIIRKQDEDDMPRIR